MATTILPNIHNGKIMNTKLHISSKVCIAASNNNNNRFDCAFGFMIFCTSHYIIKRIMIQKCEKLTNEYNE